MPARELLAPILIATAKPVPRALGPLTTRNRLLVEPASWKAGSFFCLRHFGARFAVADKSGREKGPDSSAFKRIQGRPLEPKAPQGMACLWLGEF